MRCEWEMHRGFYAGAISEANAMPDPLIPAARRKKQGEGEMLLLKG
jgi:hypothetical protein